MRPRFGGRCSGRDVEILNQLDNHSGCAIRSTVRFSFNATDVVDAFVAASDQHGPPATYLMDNAAVFSAASRGWGWVDLERELVAHGVSLRHSRPSHPQTAAGSSDSTGP